MLWYNPTDHLVAGTDAGLFAWKIDESCIKSRVTKPRYPSTFFLFVDFSCWFWFRYPQLQLCLPNVDKEAYVDSIVGLRHDLAGLFNPIQVMKITYFCSMQSGWQRTDHCVQPERDTWQ
jgi:hypothetical protein